MEEDERTRAMLRAVTFQPVGLGNRVQLECVRAGEREIISIYFVTKSRRRPIYPVETVAARSAQGDPAGPGGERRSLFQLYLYNTMPYLGPSSIPPMCEEFLQHWNIVNATLGITPLQVVVDKGLAPRPRADLQTLKTAYEVLVGAVQGEKNDLETFTRDAERAREALCPLISAFNRKVRGSLSHTGHPSALPDAPSVTMGNTVILKAADDMMNLWGKINAMAGTPAFTPPLVVLVEQPGSATPVSVASISASTRVQALRTAVFGSGGVGGIANAEQNGTLKRAERNRLWEMEIRVLLSRYRDRIIGDYTPESNFVQSLPRLYPEATGATPEPVTAAGQWDDPPGEGLITHSATTDPDVVRYELRAVPGLLWDGDAASVIATRLVSAPGPLEFRTLWNLNAPADSIAAKVYVVTASDHERGSETVNVTRP